MGNTVIAYTCVGCKKGQMIRVTETDYEARLSGVSFTVPTVNIRRCDQCSDVSVSATELKRWKAFAIRSLKGSAKTHEAGVISHAYQCNDCNCPISSIEAYCFGVCDDCYDAAHKTVGKAL